MTLSICSGFHDKMPQPVGFNNRNVFSHSSEHQKSQIKDWQGGLLVRTLFLTCRQLPFWCSLTWWRDKALVSLPLSIKAPTLSD